MEKCKPNFDVMKSIGEHIALLKPLLPNRAVICIGEYPTKILLKAMHKSKTEEMLPVFVGKSSKEILKWSQSHLDPYSILGLDARIDTHFWFQVAPQIAKNGGLIERLKSKLAEKQYDAVIVSSIWDGFGSAFLPLVISQLEELNISSLALAILPSEIQPSDVHFNAVSAIGLNAQKDSTPIVLADRDRLESYVGVDRNGFTIAGNTIVNYLLGLFANKDTLVQELSELARAFNVKIFTVMATTGASLKVYGSIDNILNAALLNPFLTFELSSISVVYVLLRMPLQFKDKLSRGSIELNIANWFKKRGKPSSICVAEPIYVGDVSDRIDMVLFVGGFDLTELVTSLRKKGNAAKIKVAKKGWIKEDEWKSIIKSLRVSES